MRLCKTKFIFMTGLAILTFSLMQRSVSQAQRKSKHNSSSQPVLVAKEPKHNLAAKQKKQLLQKLETACAYWYEKNYQLEKLKLGYKEKFCSCLSRNYLRLALTKEDPIKLMSFFTGMYDDSLSDKEVSKGTGDFINGIYHIQKGCGKSYTYVLPLDRELPLEDESGGVNQNQ